MMVMISMKLQVEIWYNMDAKLSYVIQALNSANFMFVRLYRRKAGSDDNINQQPANLP
jgi:hypothetical protein